MVSRITAQLPVEGLLFWKLEGSEALSEPFNFRVTLLGADARIDRRALLGQPITLTIPGQSLHSPRYLNGKITRLAVHSQELSDTRYAVYALTVEPDIWPMLRDKNLRIFQGQTAPQIIKTLLHEYNIHLEERLSGDYRIWEYCVQYQESSFAFISRLMELEGIYYFFRHEQDSHVMVLADAALHHRPFPGYEAIPYHVTPSGGSTSREGIGQWTPEDRVTPGIYSLDDYDFRKPYAWMFQARQNPASPQPGQIDVYDWPGHFVEHADGEHYARIRQQEWQAAHQQISGTGTALGLAPGHTFRLYNAPFLSDDGEYHIISAQYHFEENRYTSGDNSTTRQQIDFRVIPADVTFRAPPVTPWPKTHGPQTARVTGPKGETIWTDKYGRIKVRFHWDRLAKDDDTSSCWVRVSSAWAGQGFGGVQIPRINDEVVIDFINGDPDRPLVIGRVYNEARMPPWALPAAATQMGFLSRSKDGSPDNANALRFDDKTGSEQVWIQAERNMDIQVKHDASTHINNDHTQSIGGNEVLKVAKDHTSAVRGHSTLLTGKSRSDNAVGPFIIGSGDSIRLECGKSVIELTHEGDINISGVNFNLTVENDGTINTTRSGLHFNPDQGHANTVAPGGGHKDNIQADVDSLFDSTDKEQNNG